MIDNWFIKLLISRKILFKIYLDLELEFDKLNTNFVYDEVDFYNNKIEGIPTFLKLEKSNKKSYENIPHIDYSRLQKNQKYCIIEFKHLKSYSTKAVLTKSSLILRSIRFKKNNFKKF